MDFIQGIQDSRITYLNQSGETGDPGGTGESG